MSCPTDIASKGYVDSSVASLANRITELENQLSDKADKNYVDTQDLEVKTAGFAYTNESINPLQVAIDAIAAALGLLQATVEGIQWLAEQAYNLAVSINQIVTALTALPGRVSALESDVSYIMNQITNLINLIDGLYTYVDSQISNLRDSLTTRIINLENFVSEIRLDLISRIDAINSSLASLETELTNYIDNIKNDLISRIDAINSSLTSLETELTNYIDNIKNDLISRINAINSSLISLEVELTNYINNIRNDLLSRIEGVQDSLGNIQDEVNRVKDSLGNIQDELGEVKDDVQDLERKTDDIQDNVQDLQVKTDGIQDKINEVDNAQNEVERKIPLLEAGINDLEETKCCVSAVTVTPQLIKNAMGQTFLEVEVGLVLIRNNKVVDLVSSGAVFLPTFEPLSLTIANSFNGNNELITDIEFRYIKDDRIDSIQAAARCLIDYQINNLELLLNTDPDGWLYGQIQAGNRLSSDRTRLPVFSPELMPNLGFNLTYQNDVLTGSVSLDDIVVSDSVPIDLSRFALKTDFETHKNQGIPDAHSLSITPSLNLSLNNNVLTTNLNLGAFGSASDSQDLSFPWDFDWINSNNELSLDFTIGNQSKRKSVSVSGGDYEIQNFDIWFNPDDLKFYAFLKIKNIGEKTATLEDFDLEEILALLRKIYGALGGDALWESGSFSINLGQNIEGKGNQLYNAQGVEQSITINNLFDAITYNNAATFARLGLDKLPADVPKNPNAKIGSSEASEVEKQLSFLDLWLWDWKQMDARLGKFPVEIKIEDSDLIKTGDQPINLEFANLAELVTEAMGLSLIIKSVVEADLNCNLRTLGEVGSTRIQSIVTYRLLETIQTYLGYQTKKKFSKLALAFNPTTVDEEKPDEIISISDTLTESEVDIEIEVFDDEKALPDYLIPLVHSAAIIRAQNFRPISDTEALKNFFKAVNEADNTEDDFDTFLEDVERGFTTKPGIIDPLNPYGKKYENRPKINEIGDQTE